MYQDYLDDVVNYYRTGERNAELPQRLICPTPASIKTECLSVCKTRFQKKDLRTLTAFFAVESDQDAMLRAIRRCERDRFKPLANFLKSLTITTDDLNIELLAWLIDFPDRPFRPEGQSNKAPEISDGPEVNSNVDESFTGNSSDAGVDKATGKELTIGQNTITDVLKQFAFLSTAKKLALLMIGILLPALVGFYFVIDGETVFAIFNNPQQKCMIWVGDHYLPSSCEPRLGDTVVVAFDAQRINNFKRITRPDTITILSEGLLWYIKRNGKIEYYTAGGRHPVDQGRILKPLTKYMILKYKDSPQ